jgi:hypothetical protein
MSRAPVLAVQTLALLAPLAAVALFADGALRDVLAVAAVLAWAILIRVWPEPVDEWRDVDRRTLFVVRLLPILVAASIAEEVADRRWFPFTFAAIAWPLTLAARALLRGRRHGPHARAG